MRIALGLEYDGSAFCGWQSQPSRLRRAGRARARAVRDRRRAGARRPRRAAPTPACTRRRRSSHFDAPAARPATAWVRGVNALLPPAAAVLWAQPVADDFHARFAATARHYTYLLLTRAVSARRCSRGRVGWYHPRSTSARCATAAARARRHARFLGVPRGGMPGEIAGEDAVARLDVDGDGAPRAVRLSAPTRSCITWCATSSARSCTSGSGRQPPAWIARAAGRARPHAGRADVRGRRPVSVRRRLRRALRRCRRRARRRAAV